jgi:hypothetical protein
MLRSIGLLRKGLFGKKQTSWQVVPADAQQFEEAARRVCELILKRDVRIGKVPNSAKNRRRSKGKPADTSRTSTAKSRGRPQRPGRRTQ